MDMIPMKRVAITIILLTLIITLPIASARGVSEPTQRDVFIYHYFSEVLIRFEYSLKYAAMNNTYSVELANMTLAELTEINQQAIYYREKGIDSPVMEVIPPFYGFAEELLALTNMTILFQRYPTLAFATGIQKTIAKMEGQLAEIKGLRLRNGTKVLKFNVGGVEKQLNAIEELVSNTSLTRDFEIGVSNANPILRQNITIFGSSPWNDTILLTIKGRNGTTVLPIKPSDRGDFSLSYSFSRPGNYTLYATHGANRSNTVKVRVRKIPTSFIIPDTCSALIGHTLTLAGVLADRYGETLAGREISVNNRTEVTNGTGGFSIEYFSRTATEFTVVLRFRGDDEHSPTTKTVRVVFTKYPVAITLHGPSRATVGKAATFRGNVTIPGRAVLEVYVNGKKNLTVVSRNGGFSFRLTPEKRGRFKVYVAFEGNEEYQKALSNAVVLEAVPPANPLIRYVELALVALLLVGVVVAGRRRAARVENPEPIAERTKGGSAEERRGVPSDVGEAYTLLRSLLSRKLGISESLTPREALEALRDWELYPELEKATLLHEKAVYGGAALTPEEAAEFKWAVENIMRGLAG